jgi:hypothetical protein
VLRPKSFSYHWASVVLYLAIASCAFSQETAGMRMVPEVKIPSYELFEKDPNSRWPLWSGGGLIAYEHNKSATPVIHVFDANGGDSPIVFSIDGADMVHILHAVRGTDGTIAVGGRAYSSTFQGRAWNPDGFYTGFISWIAPDHQSATTIRLSGFYSPALVALTPDGSIWTKGWESTDIKGYGEDRNAPVMRHFDKTGKMIGSALPAKLLSHLSKSTYTDDFGYMVSSSSRVGWMQNDSNYYEFSFDGQDVVEFPPLPIPPHKSILVGLALLDNGKVFASTSVFTGSEFPHGIFLYALDRGNKEWRPIDALHAFGSGNSNYLLGGSGNTLVLKSKDDPAVERLIRVN